MKKTSEVSQTSEVFFMTFVIGHLADEALRDPALEIIELSGYRWTI